MTDTPHEDPHESPFGEEDAGGDAGASGAHEAIEDDAAEARATPITAPGGKHLTLREFREQSERQYIVDTLKMAGWNISRTAVMLGVERTNLHKKIRAYAIKRGEG